MCGISGIVKFDRRSRVEEKRLRAMSDSLWHRGPDDGGLMVNGHVGLAHRRLSIIDLANGKQPMASPWRSTWITYNGELYNYRELRSQLQSRGCSFTTQSDTEVILRAYDVYGDGCVEHLRGMFAFAVWDADRQRLLAVRDRMGIKPLYFSMGDGELLFGSEIKAILAARKDRPVFNRAILPEYLACRYVSGPETFFEGIYKLLPGHALSWSPDEGLRDRRYWYLPQTQEADPGLSRHEHVAMVRHGLTDAVQSHLVSDVPVGLFLSGGIDSSILAALMAPMTDEPINTFSVGFEESDANELDYARLAAESVGARHQQLKLSAREFFASLPQLIWHEDEPLAFTSSVPLHAISRLASEHVKVVLTGEGADELFLGYDYRYRVTHWNHRLGGLYSGLVPGSARQALAGLVPNLPSPMRRYAERTFLALDHNPRELFFENFSVFRSGQRQALLRSPAVHEGRDPHAGGLRHYHAAGTDPLQCMSHADMQTYLVELLMKQDQMSMSASLESRVPFLDHRLVEQVAGMPGRYKMRGWQTKMLLRDAVGDMVPDAILNRRKMGFPVPTSQWLRGRYWPLVEEFVLGSRAAARGHFNRDALARLAHEHRRGSFDHGERLWLLINLEIWQRIFIDGEDPARIIPGIHPSEEKAA